MSNRKTQILYSPAPRLDVTPTQVRSIRVGLGLNKREFAEKLGVTPQTIWNWESGRRPVGQDSTYRIVTMAQNQGVRYD